jgi:hypothetical protein
MVTIPLPREAAISDVPGDPSSHTMSASRCHGGLDRQVLGRLQLHTRLTGDAMPEDAADLAGATAVMAYQRPLQLLVRRAPHRRAG